MLSSTIKYFILTVSHFLELFHTERTHVRNLKILYKVFYKPMVLQNIVPPEVIKLFFPNLEELLEVHGNMSR